MTELRKITWYENSLEDGTKILVAVIRPDGDVHNSTRIGEVRTHLDGTTRAHSEILKGYNLYRNSVGRPSVEEGKAFICKTFRDAMKLIVCGDVKLHKDDIIESDDYVPSNWFSGDDEFDKEFTEKARKFKEGMKSGSIEEMVKVAEKWKEDTEFDKFPKLPYGHKLYRTAKECAEDWFIECYYTVKDVNEAVSYAYYKG